MARDIAIKFHNEFGNVFTVPEPEIPEEIAVIPGTDGQKMSKSYGNTIPIFADDNAIKKAVMGIITDFLQIFEMFRVKFPISSSSIQGQKSEIVVI